MTKKILKTLRLVGPSGLPRAALDNYIFRGNCKTLETFSYLVSHYVGEILIEIHFIYLQHSIFSDASIGKGVSMLVQDFLNELTTFAPPTA